MGLLVVITTFSLTAMEYASAQYSESYCLDKKTELMSRGSDWDKQWSTKDVDVNGIIRSDGKQLTSEIGLTLVNCQPYLDAQNLLDLTNMKMVIDASIDKNINYGPPCDPLCASGPPIEYR